MQIPMPDDWDGVSTCRWSVCWPDSSKWKAILFGLLSAPSQGRFWDFNTGNFLDLRATFLPIYTKNFNLPGVIMACDDSGIAEALNAIATALANQTGDCVPPSIFVPPPNISVSCYSSSNTGIQTIVNLPDETIWPVFGSQPIAELPESGFPEGYPDLETYDADKCGKAAKMADDFINTLRNLSIVNWISTALGAGVLGGALVGLIVLPPAAIPVFLLILLTSLGINAFLVDFANAIEADKETLICLLYQSEGVEAVYTTLHGFLVAIVAIVDPPAGIATALVQIGMHLFNSDTLNTLFNSDAAEVYASADCSCSENCEDPEEKSWDFSINPLTAEPPWEFITVSGDVRAFEWNDAFDTLLLNVQDGSSISRWQSPDGCYEGDTFQVNLSAQANPDPLEVWGVLHYSDGTETEEMFTTSLNTLGTNYSIDVDPEKTLLWVAVDWRWSGITGGFNFSANFGAPFIFFV